MVKGSWSHVGWCVKRGDGAWVTWSARDPHSRRVLELVAVEVCFPPSGQAFRGSRKRVVEEVGVRNPGGGGAPSGMSACSCVLWSMHPGLRLLGVLGLFSIHDSIPVIP